MEMLAEDKDVLFLGQTTCFPGSPMYASLKDIPGKKKIELPVAEDMQMGMSIGLSLEGFVPVSIYPRIDFLILALNQLVNHLDKIEGMSGGEFSPKVIIRTQIGNTKPLYPGAQHCGDYTKALKILCKNIDVVKIEKAEDLMQEYKKALKSKRSTILIEIATGP